MEKKKKLSIIIAIVLIVIIILALVISNHEKIIPAKETLNILSGSENRILEPILQKFEDENNIDINMTYEGSVDIMQELQNGASQYLD